MDWLNGIINHELAPVVGILGGLALVIPWLVSLYRKYRNLKREARNFLDAFNGTAERPGFPSTPGLPERQRTTEGTVDEILQVQKQTCESLAKIVAEVEPNHGSSIKDHINRNTETIAALGTDMEHIKTILMTRQDKDT